MSQRALQTGLFTNDVLCLFVSAQSQEDRLAKLIVAGPLGKLNLSYE
jgi:hypothetical protein